MTQLSSDRLQALEARIASLPPEKRALFYAQLAQQQPAAAPSIPKRPSGSPPVLSAAQERLWVLQQISPDGAYNIAITWHIHGPLDADRLKQSINQVIDRHETLRLGIESQAGLAQPWVQASLKMDLIRTKLTGADRLAQAQAIGQADAQRLFDLTKPPMLRATLVSISPTEHDFFLTLHHLIADGWSRGVLLRELAAFYRGETALPELSRQYSDYAIWQQQWLQSPAAQASRDYWQQQLAGLEPLNMPTDYPKGTAMDAASLSVRWPLELLNRLKAFSRQTRTTLFTTLLTGFQILLHRLSGQSDIALGVPVANRELTEVRDLIGFFVNTIVLRQTIDPAMDFLTLAQRVQETVATGFEHQSYPFGNLVEQLQPDRDLRQNPLFQVMFQFQNQQYGTQNAAQVDLGDPSLSVDQTWRELGSTKFDLTWHGIEQEEGLLWVVEYRTALFRQETISGLLGQMEKLLQQAMVAGNCPVGMLSYLPDSIQAKVLRWGQGGNRSAGASLVKLLGEFARTRPGAIALQDPRRSLTYGQLWAESGQLARGLPSRSIVGLHLARSVELVVAIVAVWRAGSAYLPLDRTLPPERLAYLLADAQPSSVLTTAEGMADLQNYEGLLVQVDLGDKTTVSALEGFEDLARDANPMDLAYVIYTSGSTGQPKGTMLTHQGLNNYLSWCREAYPLDRGCGAPVQLAIGFDATITSLFGPLMVGKRVDLLPEGNDWEALQALLNPAERYSFAKVTPAQLEILTTIPARHYPHAFVIGGEALPPALVAQWRSIAPDVQLINEYGPTEAVVGCCTYDASADDLAGSDRVPIGRPIPCVHLYVLDDQGQLLPPGVPGELYIGGLGVALGYLRRPELTAEKFIPNPFGQGSLYRTGDRVKWLPDGNLDYLGRLDAQIKLRGYRIELGEIEAVLAQQPGIGQAIVLLQRMGDRPHLVAYYSGDTDDRLLRENLGRLPQYMIPSYFVRLKQLPLTQNGKVDRAALPLPEVSAVLPQDSGLNGTEQQLLDIWRQLLRRDIDRHSNFFEFGGDSILALQFVAQAQIQGIYLTPQQLFEHQTIAELATVASLEAELAELTESHGPIPLTAIQRWFFVQNLHQWQQYNQILELPVIPGLDATWLEAALQSLRSHHEALGFAFSAPIDPPQSWQQIRTDRSTPILETHDLKNLPPDEQLAEIQRRTRSAKLDPGSGDLLRARLFRLGNSDRLVFIIHHLVIDGVSWRILLGDLDLLYRQHQQSTPLQLPPKTTSFATWSRHQQHLAQAPETLRHLPHWQTLNPSSPQDYGSIATEFHQTACLDRSATTALLEALGSSAFSLETVLLTAILEGLAAPDGQRCWQIDLEHMGRGDLGRGLGQVTPGIKNHNWSRTIGWFTTLYPVLFDLKHFSTPEDRLQSVQRTQAPGQTYGLLRYLNADCAEILGGIGNSAVCFNYLGAIDQSLPSFCDRPLDPDSFLGHSSSAQAPTQQRSHGIKINAYLFQQELHWRWSCSQTLHSASTLSIITDIATAALRSLTQACQTANAAPATAPTFAAAQLDRQKISRFLGKIQSG